MRRLPAADSSSLSADVILAEWRRLDQAIEILVDEVGDEFEQSNSPRADDPYELLVADVLEYLSIRTNRETTVNSIAGVLRC